ncbi:MAG TPA: O-acetyl-ADP-ribose deacetylase [Actinomycetota bacterium]
MSVALELIRGDITTQSVDAIVNAANTALRPGGGVDGAITRAAGPEALADRERVIRERGRPPLPTGEAVATIGGDLPARWIVHTAGPVYSGSAEDAELLARCHRSALQVADELGARTVAFPAISTGVYGYPVEEAAPVAIAAVLEAEAAVEVVRFVLSSDEILAEFERASAARS